MEVKNAEEGLKRVIGVPGLTAIVINNTIGAGIYALPAIVSIQMGASGILSYFFCGAMLVTIMLCYMEIGSKINASGGSYIYVETAFGPISGFISNWLYFFGWGVLGSAAVINILADSIGVLFPVFLNPIMRAALFFILLGGMVWINVRGAKQSVKVLQYVTIIKLLPIVAVIILGASHIKTGNLRWEHWPSVKTFGDTVLVLFFAFAGFETSLGSSGEIKDPKRTVPLGIIWGGASVFIVYILLQTITQGVLGAQIGGFKDAPLAAVAQNIVGPVGASILLVGAIFSCLGNTGGDVMATPRLLYAGANDGLFPKFLGKVHPRFATPYIAVIIYASLIFIFAVSGGFRQLAVLASGSLLLVYLAVVLATIRLRYKKAQAAGKTFKAPGGLVIPVIAIIVICWLLANMSSNETLAIIIFIIVICLIYFFMKIFQKKKTIPEVVESQ